MVGNGAAPVPYVEMVVSSFCPPYGLRDCFRVGA
jgi:hypothetical protein